MSRISITRRVDLWVGGLAVAVAGLLFVVEKDGRAQPPRAGRITTAEGVVKEYTTAPLGEIDGAVLDDGTTLHWPPHLADIFSGVAIKGDKVRASGWMETGPAGETHFEVQQLTNQQTRKSATNDGGLPAPPPAKGPVGQVPPRPPAPLDPVPARGNADSAEGVVTQFTTAPLGEIDGAILDNGTILHWPPDMADRYSRVAIKGDRVRATGRTETGPAGDSHFEVQQLIKIDNLPPGKVAQSPADLDQRLRVLERQVDLLRKEIERLRRDR